MHFQVRSTRRVPLEHVLLDENQFYIIFFTWAGLSLANCELFHNDMTIFSVFVWLRNQGISADTPDLRYSLVFELRTTGSAYLWGPNPRLETLLILHGPYILGSFHQLFTVTSTGNEDHGYYNGHTDSDRRPAEPADCKLRKLNCKSSTEKLAKKGQNWRLDFFGKAARKLSSDWFIKAVQGFAT